MPPGSVADAPGTLSFVNLKVRVGLSCATATMANSKVNPSMQTIDFFMFSSSQIRDQRLDRSYVLGIESHARRQNTELNTRLLFFCESTICACDLPSAAQTAARSAL